MGWYLMSYETTYVHAIIDPRGTPAAGNGAAVPECVHPAAVPDSTRQCTRTTSRADRPTAQLCDPECAQCDPGLPHPWAGLVIGSIAAAQADACRARCGQRRAVARPAARTAPCFW